MLNLDKKRIMVTGCNGQLGRAICSFLTDHGSEVIGCDIPDEPDHRVKDLIRYVAIDITTKRDVYDSMQTIFREIGPVDSLVCNAGVSVFEPFMSRPESSIDSVYSVNLKGTINCIMAYLQELEAMGNTPPKSIVNIASIYGIVSPDPRIYVDLDRQNSEIYGATKAGVIQLTKYYAVHAKRLNVRVNSVSPGGVLNQDSPQGVGFQEEYSKRCPMGRLAKDYEIASSVAFLTSDLSSYINGHNLVVDGGLTAW